MAKITLETLREFEKTVGQMIPGFEVRFKDESKLMKVLGTFVRPFNPQFLTDYTTTIGTNVYFPSKNFYVTDPARQLVVLAHESVHMWDEQLHGKKYKLTYAMPQVFSLVPFILYGIFGSVLPLLIFLGSYVAAAVLTRKALFWIVFIGATLATLYFAWVWTGLWSLLLLAGVACLGPWPSSGRTRWEVRGYTMNVAMRVWLYGRLSDSNKEFIYENFTGPGYWFMCRNKEELVRAFDEAEAKAESGELAQDDPYRVVYLFLQDRELLRH